jgi:hypothetical protein
MEASQAPTRRYPLIDWWRRSALSTVNHHEVIEKVRAEAGARAVVRAVTLPGATLATYRTLEKRVELAESGWQVNLIPPAAAALPAVTLGEDGQADAAGREALATAIWGARRLNLRIGVAAASGQATDEVLHAFAAAGVEARAAEGAADADRVTLRWVVPEPEPQAAPAPE